ncbi:MAG: glycosyltransferase [Oscillospiraceae bacterium]|nr:glycosyltransferase [Oscillospiraceae bacterium]
MKLSIGMIVKNEEKYLERCLTALKPILENVDSELIIADTGSTDRTVEIAKKFTENVFHFEWINDFAAARNSTLDHARGEWYMYIDADEIARDCTGIIKFFNSGDYKKFNTAVCSLRNYFDTVKPDGYSLMKSTRLFSAKNGVRFKNPIHEIITEILGPIAQLDLVFDHYGYAISENGVPNGVAKKKAERNLPLLLEELEESEARGETQDPRVYSQIGDCYSMTNKSDKALEYYKKGFEAADKSSITVIHYYSSILAEMVYIGLNDEAMELCNKYFSKENIARKKPLATDCFVYVCRARINFKLKNYDEVISDLIPAFDIYDRYINNRLVAEDTLVTGFRVSPNKIKLSLFTFGRACEETGRYKEAAEALKNFTLSECLSDSSFMRSHIRQRINMMEHTDFSSLAVLYNKLDEPNNELLVNEMFWHIFETNKPEQVIAAVKKIIKGDKRLEETVRLYEYFVLRKDLTFEAVKKYIEKYGALGNENILCLMMRASFDITPFITADSIDAGNSAGSVFLNLRSAAKLFAEYDINAISPEGLEKAAALYKLALSGAQQNKAEITPLFEKFGTIGTRWFENYPDSESFPDDIKAALMANTVTIARNAGNNELCESELTGMAQTFPDLAPIIWAYSKEAGLDVKVKQAKQKNDFHFDMGSTYGKKNVSLKIGNLLEQSSAKPSEPPKPPKPKDEFAALAQQFKQNIRSLTDAGKFDDAKALIAEYEKLCPNDPELGELKKLSVPDTVSEFEKLSKQVKQNIISMINAGDIAGAQSLTAEYAQLCPDDPELKLIKLRILAKNKNE